MSQVTTQNKTPYGLLVGNFQFYFTVQLLQTHVSIQPVCVRISIFVYLVGLIFIDTQLSATVKLDAPPPPTLNVHVYNQQSPLLGNQRRAQT